MEDRKQAVALQYNQQENRAPKLVAKGSGMIAEQVISVAQQNSVPIYQNKTLAGMLMTLDIDREIPPELYQAVAEVLAYVYRVDERLKHVKPQKN